MARTSRTLIFEANGMTCNQGRVESPPFEAPPDCGLAGVANLRPGRPRLALAGGTRLV